ncbi:MAG TPA: hypothetical protein VJM74_04410 [Nitrososphaeraceae archaeon]|nr:hypothetical protein [Nitrososphaeraceae archaeon]
MSTLPVVTNKGPDKAEALEVTYMFHGIENGWYFAVAISIPLVIWFFITRRHELKGKEKITKASDIFAD